MIDVSKIILGTVQFGCQYGINSKGRPSIDQVSDILNLAKDGGIQILDTSPAYGDAEQILGKVEVTKQFKIVSKYPKGDESVEEMFAQSCEHLCTNHLYGYILHHFESFQSNPQIWNSFEKLKKDSKIDRVGFSLYEPKELDLILSQNIHFDLLQIPYNLLDRQFEPYFEQLNKMGVEIHARSTFLQGLFFMDRNMLPDKLKPMRKYLDQLDEYASLNNLSTSEVALNYNLQNPYIDGVLIGVDNEIQLKQNIDSIMDIPINLDIQVKEQELLKPVNWK